MTTTIAYIAPWVTVGGSDKATVDWFRRIDRDRFRPILVTTQASANERLGLIEPYAAEIHVLANRMPGGEMPAFVAELVESRDIRLVHVTNSRLGFDLLPALRDAYPRLATVVQLHAEEVDRSGYVRYVAGRYDDVVDAYSVASRDLRDRLAGYGVAAEKIDVVYVGVDGSREFTPGPRPDPLPYAERQPPGLEILYVSRLEPEKDPMLMVQVAAGLRDAGSRARVHVLGDGRLRDDVERAVIAAQLEERVLLHGAVGSMCSWYRATDAVLLTSAFEGVPLAAYEAMACARPVVAPAVGGIGELVDDATGLLVSERADPARYVDAILRLEHDPSLGRELGTAGRRRVVAGFALEHMIGAHELLYDRVLAARAGNDAGRFDGGAWRGWAPRATVPLWLDLVAAPGADRLAASVTPPCGGAWALVARVWGRPFPGTDPLDLGHCDATMPSPWGLGYASRDPLPGMVALRAVLGEAAPGDAALTAAPGWVEPAAPGSGPASRPWVSLAPR